MGCLRLLDTGAVTLMSTYAGGTPIEKAKRLDKERYSQIRQYIKGKPNPPVSKFGQGVASAVYCMT